MNNERKVALIFKDCVILFIFFDIIFTYYSNLYLLSIYVLLTAVLFISALARNRFLNKSQYLFNLNMIISIITCGLLIYRINNIGAIIYIIIDLISIIGLTDVKSKVMLLFIHAATYIISMRLINYSYVSGENLYYLMMSIFSYISNIIIGYIFKINNEEREKIQLLNIELKESNSMLQDYSIKLKELTKSEERNRVAQELHDSLGHSLIGLAMHLDFVENIIDNNPNKAKEIVIKCRQMIGESIGDLRKTVYELRDEGIIDSLEEGLNDLKYKFTIDDRVKININFERNLEKLEPVTKNVIYKTVQEGLTNGIKHGKATEFLIDLSINKKNVLIKIEDNGVGCSKIIKSNGLKGIENRIEKLSGTVEFLSQNGFHILSRIPVKGEKEID